MIDKDGSGSISAKELKYALLKFGQELSDVEHAQVMKKYDTNHDGKISFEGKFILV
jgi:Ca2+-binding EF-hand superfamily protein